MEADVGRVQAPIDWGTGRSSGVGRSFVNRMMRITLFAPDIQEAICEGRLPKAMQLEELVDVHSKQMGESAERSFVRA